MWVIGISHRRAPVALREQLAFGLQDVPHALGVLQAQGFLGVLLSTCNRTEFYSAGEASDAPGAFAVLCHLRGVAPSLLEPYRYLHEGDDAARHLFRVIAGLDSQIVGEGQVANQVGQAYALAEEITAPGPGLAGLFQRAQHVARRVRRETGIAGYAGSSVSGAAIATAQRVFPDLATRTVLVIGAGSVGKLAAEALSHHGVGRLWVTTRTAARGRQLAMALGANDVPWSALPQALSEADVVLSGTGSPSRILTRELLATVPRDGDRPLLLIDLAVPRDIDPEAGQLPGITLLNVDDIHLSTCQTGWPPPDVVARAESIVEEELERYRQWSAERRMSPLVGGLRRRAEAVRRHALGRTLARLPDLKPAEIERVEALSRAIVKQLLHEPTVRLKASEPDSPLAQAAQTLFGLGEHRA